MKTKSKEHLQLVKNIWDTNLKLGDTVVDATMGNGHDSMYLAQKVLGNNCGWLYGYDIQKKAHANTRQRLEDHLTSQQIQRVSLFEKSHEDFSDVPLKKSVTLIAYNLGYLPGSDKLITTKSSTTLKSLYSAIDLDPQLLTIVCYSGHSAGKQEENALYNFLSPLDPHKWSIQWTRWVNRDLFPSVFIIQNRSR